MDTDKHGWGKDFDANCTNFREGGRGWMGYLRTAAGHNSRAEMKSAKRPSAFAKASARQDENEKIKPN